MLRARKRISSFAYLNVAQFFGATNDNIFKIVIAFLLIGLYGEGAVNLIMVTSGAAFVLPFLLFSIPAGTLADRYSKRTITVLTKALEVVVMALGIWAFGTKSTWGAYSVLFLMATQSALFGPSKYGIVPELVPTEKIAPANGILTGLTVIATIFGSFLASILTEVTDRNFVLVAIFCVGLAVLGFIASFGIERTPAAGGEQKVSAKVASELWRVIKRSRTESYLFAALLGTSYFYLIGAFTQLNIIPFAIQSLHLPAEHGNYLFAIAAFGIALGAFIAGKLSGDEVELGICPLAALGMALALMLTYPLQHMLYPLAVLIFIQGVFGGAFLVPFDAYIQAASPSRHRGENVAASSFLSFFGVALATGILFILGNLLGLDAATGFMVMGGVTLAVALSLSYRLSDTYVRLFSRLAYRRGDGYGTEGQNLIDSEKPTLFICQTDDWWAAFCLLITLQTRYMRFVIQHPSNLSLPLRIFCKMGKVAFYSKQPAEAAAHGQEWLRRGYHLAVIPRQGADFQEVLQSARHLLVDESTPILTAEVRQQENRPHIELTASI